MADAKPKSMEQLFAVVRETQDANLRLHDSGERARAKARLLQALDEVEAGTRPAASTPAPAGNSWRWGLGTLAAAACAVTLMFAWPGEQTLSYEVDGVDYAANHMIRADHGSRSLSFSDGSAVELAPGSRAKVSELRDNGATVSLMSGDVSLAIHHESDTSWQVEAGPWTVHVTGTQFTVTWKPQIEYFRVAVSEGSVRVEGPEGELAKLRAGESLVRERGKATIEPETLDVAHAPEFVHADASETSESGAEAEAPRELSPVIDEAAEPNTHAGSSAHQASSPTKLPAAKPSWLGHFNDGEYELAWQVLDNEPGGIHGVAKHASAGTLLDLADIARFTKHADDAELLLEQLRADHPGRSEAADAAFALGRLAMDRGAHSKAATYFEHYVGEAPNGTFASDALRRLIDCYIALGRDDEARSAAERYLDEYPQGPHATKAQSILNP